MSLKETNQSEARNLSVRWISSTPLVPLSPELSRSIFILDYFLGRKQAMAGTEYHRIVGEWIETGKSLEADLFAFLTDRYPSARPPRRHFDHALRRSDQWRNKGIWAAACSAELSALGGRGKSSLDSREESDRPTHGKVEVEAITPAGPPPCPRVLFGTGAMPWSRPRIAFFNSRKPRLVLPHEEWPEALRSILRRFAPMKPAFAGSLGTLTYDLLTAYAQRVKAPLLLVTSSVVEDTGVPGMFPLDGGAIPPDTTLTCLTRSIRCPKHARMVCRDRILASLADIHIALEVRAGGNLLRVLEEEQDRKPRPLWVYGPRKRHAENQGNFVLMEKLRPRTEAFSIESAVGAEENDPADRPHSMPFPRMPGASATLDPRKIDWRNYLYHYTRSCPNPWPGQCYREYLLAILDADPLCAHTTLDTLIRILREGRLRAASTLVRGEQPVVSFSSRPPPELDRLRRWSPALIRWTFEPFGIALEKGELRKRGVKPTIYAREEAYVRLSPADRFRFQRHEPPRCSWTHEREWRLPGDVVLPEIPAGKGFVFVSDAVDRSRLLDMIGSPPFAVVTLSDLGR